MKMLMEDIAAFTNVLGVSNPDLIWSLATVPWKSQSDRDMFIAEVGNMTGGVSA